MSTFADLFREIPPSIAIDPLEVTLLFRAEHQGRHRVGERWWLPAPIYVAEFYGMTRRVRRPRLNKDEQRAERRRQAHNRNVERLKRTIQHELAKHLRRQAVYPQLITRETRDRLKDAVTDYLNEISTMERIP